MAFHVLANSTTADAADVNDNFYWIGQGTRLPMGGASLDYTNGVYDIGSTTNRFKTVYATNLNISGSITTNKQMFTLISEITLTATVSALSNVTFSGLNGDADIEYRIISYTLLNGGAVGLVLYINGDSGTNYGSQELIGISTAVSAGRTSDNYIRIGAMSLASFCDLSIYSKTGSYRTGVGMRAYQINGVTVTNLVLYGVSWNNTTSTITSLVFQPSGNLQPGTNIQIWGRK